MVTKNIDLNSSKILTNTFYIFCKYLYIKTEFVRYIASPSKRGLG